MPQGAWALISVLCFSAWYSVEPKRDPGAEDWGEKNGQVFVGEDGCVIEIHRSLANVVPNIYIYIDMI